MFIKLSVRLAILAIVSAYITSQCLLPATAHAQEAADSSKARAELEQLQRSIAKVQKQLNSYKGKQRSLQRDLRDIEKKMGQRLASIHQAKQLLNSEQSKLGSLQQQEKSLKAARDAQQEAMTDIIRDAYKQGHQSRIKLLMNQQDPAEIERLLKYYEYINKARYAQIKDYLKTLNNIQRLKPELINTRDAITLQLTALESQQRKLENDQQQRQQTLQRINSQITSKTELLASQEQESQQLEAFIQEIERQINEMSLTLNNVAFKSRKGNMNWPSNGSMLNKYGQQKQDSKFRWLGVSFAAEQNSDVTAIHPGRVVFADWFSQMGLLVMVDHGDKYLSLYAHNASLLIELGDTVEAGEAIATVGKSGGQNNNALYFEIRHAGKPINPAQWCQ